MTLTKEHIIESIHNNCDISKARSEAVFESVMEGIRNAPASGEVVKNCHLQAFRVVEGEDEWGRVRA